uniref:dual specificity testis-specific protein kinase 2-like isoform X2 n=2 Tax=Myxine glutinosa TaxID=7769 RepID=UPI0035900D02
MPCSYHQRSPAQSVTISSSWRSSYQKQSVAHGALSAPLQLIDPNSFSPHLYLLTRLISFSPHLSKQSLATAFIVRCGIKPPAPMTRLPVGSPRRWLAGKGSLAPPLMIVCNSSNQTATLANIEMELILAMPLTLCAAAVNVKHKATGRVMALKMNVQKGNRFNMLVEVQLLNRLWHPNVLRYLGACVHEGQLHALTEYINGGNLEQLLASNARLPWSRRVKLALDLARGLKYLHSRGVFHRDLTSKNCLVREDSHGLTAVIGDFGLAGRIPDADDTQMLSVVGSPFWMAPEVLRGEFYNQKVDVFSYGIILCEIIARVQADPDYLPRTKDFGLDHEAFRHMVGDCPEAFLQLAFSCCNVQHICRPLVSEVVQELEALLQQLQQEEAESQSVPEYLELQGTSTLIDGPLTCSQSDISCLTPPTTARTPKLNPFSARKELNGGHTKLYDTQTRPSLPPLAIAMPLSPFPTPPSTPQPYHLPKEPPARRCRSLPTSPLLTHHCQRTLPMSRHYPQALVDIPSHDLDYGTGSPFDYGNNPKVDPRKMKAFGGCGVSRLPPTTASPAMVYYPSKSSSGGYLSSHSDEQSPVGSHSEGGVPRRPHCQKAMSSPCHHKNELPLQMDTPHPPNLVEDDRCLSLSNQASLSSVSELDSISSSDTSCGQGDVTFRL